jgi:hypothetical protein
LEGHGRYHGRGIDAAGEKRAERHVGHHADPDGFIEFFEKLRDRLLLGQTGPRLGGGGRQFPIALLLDRAIGPVT